MATILVVDDDGANKVAEARSLSDRFAKLVELSHEVNLEQDSQRLLETFCIAGCELVGTEYTGIGILANDAMRLDRFAVRGIDRAAVWDSDSISAVSWSIATEAGSGRRASRAPAPHFCSRFLSSLQRLKSLVPLSGVPVFVVSAREPATKKERASAAGAHRYFQKPVDFDGLVTAIGQAVGGGLAV
jgi:hypothetical protein